MNEETRLRRSWDENAGAWTRAVRGDGIESRRLGTDTSVVEMLRSLGCRRVLDVGCGEGWLARALAGAGIDVTGLDGSERLVAAAREGGGGRFHVLTYADLVEHPTVLPGPFDCAVCNFSLLGERIAGVLAALAGRLAADGALVIQTVHPFTMVEDGSYGDGWRDEDFRGMGEPFPARMPWFFRTLESWSREIGAAGLRVAEIAEPMPDGAGRPLSLLLVCRPERSSGVDETRMGDGRR